MLPSLNFRASVDKRNTKAKKKISDANENSDSSEERKKPKVLLP